MTTDIASSEQIAWVLEAQVHPGSRPAMEEIIHEAVAATRADPKAVNYEFFLDGDALQVYEKYADSPATLAHLAWFGNTIAGRFLSIADITRFTIYGSPSSEVRQVLDGMGATYLKEFAGFAR